MAINFQLLRSSTASKRPTAANLDTGELGLNFSDNTGGLFYENASGNIVKVGPAEVGTTAPNSSPAAGGSSGNSLGEFWYDTASSQLKVWTGSSFDTSATSAGGNTTEVQFNNAGALAGDSNFTYDSASETLSVTDVHADLDGAVVFTAEASVNISRGEAVYIDGIQGNNPTVALARANSASTMPAFGIADEDITAGSTGHIVSFGQIGNLNTDTPGFALGDTLFVSAATAGGITNAAPTGETSLIQNVGRVERVSTTVGRIVVVGAGRTNATPNLNNGNIFVGNGSNQSVADSFTDVLNAQAGINSTANATAITIDISEKVTLAGALDVAGLAEFESNVQFGTGFGAGVDVLFYGAANNSLLTWDASADALVFNANAGLTVPDGNLTLNATAVTSTAVELNRLDGVVPGTVAGAKAVVVDTNDDVSGFRNVSLVGELDTATLDVSSTSAFAGNLTVENAKEVRFSEATTNGTNFTGFKAPAALTADVTFTLPDGDGTSGQTILTDGSGTLTWGSGSVAGIVSNANATAMTIDANENIVIEGAVQFKGNLDLFGARNLTLETNTAAAFDILDGSNSYLKFDTTSGSELVTVSKSLTLGGADLNAAVALDLTMVDNTASAFRIVEGSNPYLSIDTFNGAELITISKNMDLEGSQIRTLAATDIRVLINNALALRIEDGNGNEYLRVNTVDEKISLARTLETNGLLQMDGGALLANGTSISMADNSGFAFRVMEGTNEYMRFTTTDGGEKIVTQKALEVNGALDIDGAVDCSGDITFSDAQTISVVDNLGFALRIMEGTDEYMRVITTNGNESVQFDKAVVVSDTLVFNSGAFLNGSIDFSLQPTNSNALDFTINGGNNMMRFNTNTETVLVPVAFEVDGGARFDGAMDVNSTVDISGGEVTFSANADIQLVDNSGQALDIAEGANNYVRFITTDDSEEIEIYQDIELKAEHISLTGTAGVDLTFINNFGSALTFKDTTGAIYQSFRTTSPQVQFLQDIFVQTGFSLTLDSVEIANVQSSGETFADNDTSIMTSAAVKDLVDTVSGVTQTEGNFTATFRGSTAEPGTLVTTTGYFVQVGKMVTATIDTGAVSWTGYGGIATVTGMPATAKSGFDFVGSFYSSGGLFESSNNDGIVCHMDGNTTVLDLRAQDSSSSPTWSPSGIDTIMFTITYFTA